MNQMPDAPLNRLERILKKMEIFLGEIILPELETSDVNSEKIRLQVLKAKQSITEVYNTIEETRKIAYEEAYGTGTWQNMPLNNQQKIYYIRELKETLEQIERELAQG
jgi:thymidylate synthase